MATLISARPQGVAIGRAIASGGRIGFFPWAPGTAGSAAAVAVGAAILHLAGPLALAVAAAAAALGGIWASAPPAPRTIPAGW